MHDQLCHCRPVLPVRGQVQIAEDLLATFISGQQMSGAVVRQLAQDLLTDGCDRIEFGCGSDEFTDMALLVSSQRRSPLRPRH